MSMEMGISVLMSVYKKEKPEYLLEALRSLTVQTRLPDEIVLVKDGPLTEELDLCIEEFQKKCPYLRVIPLPENVQLGRALASGLVECKYALVARMDSDDISLPERLEKQYTYMIAHPKISVLGGWIEEFDDAGTYVSLKKVPEKNAEIRRYGRYRNPINHVTTMFRKEDVLAAGNYMHVPYLEDYDLWCRMMVQGREFYSLQESLVRVRTNFGMYGRRGGFAYFRRYADFRKRQREMGLLNGKEYLLALILTFGITMQPAFLRKLVYQKILRK